MSTSIIAENKTQSRASSLPAGERQQLAISVLSKNENVSELARENEVSRKFLYKNASVAEKALQNAYQEEEKAQEHPDEKVMFHLPVTKKTIKLITLVLTLVCHAPFRGIQFFFEAVFDYHISLGTIHNIHQSVVPIARSINEQQCLKKIQAGAHDEIYQGKFPVLTGVDLDSTYCYLLKKEEHCDGDTWGVHLLDLQEKQNLTPKYIIADFGKGLRAGHRGVWSSIECRGDIFHSIYDLRKLCRFLHKKATEAKTKRKLLEKSIQKKKQRGKGQKLSRKLGHARSVEKKAARLFEDIATLSQWMQEDVFALHGPPHEVRTQMYSFIVEELKKLESQCSHRIRPIRVLLENHQEELLLFAKEIDAKVSKLAETRGLTTIQVFEVIETMSLDPDSTVRWCREAEHYETFGIEGYDQLYASIERMLYSIHRASSMVENLNGRLRNYFFLRRQLGDDYLSLLQFYLNHQRYKRSAYKKRIGKSPKELLTGEEHPHWLELLGFTLFKRS